MRAKKTISCQGFFDIAADGKPYSTYMRANNQTRFWCLFGVYFRENRRIRKETP